MKKKSSYIIFDNPHYVEQNIQVDETAIVVDIDSPKSRLISALGVEESVQECGLLHYKASFYVGDCVVLLHIQELKTATYVVLEAEAKYQSRIVKCLEHCQSKMEEANADDRYVIIYAYDFVSEYYCNRIYPKLNEMERHLRELLLNTYTLNYGLKYYEPTINDALIHNNMHIVKADSNRKEKKDIQLAKQFFYSLDYGQIQQLLFTPQWAQTDELQKKAFLKEHEDLTQLSDNALREAFGKFVPRSDWERLFARKVKSKADVSALIDDVRKHRNQVAHCKFFSAEEYRECLRKINKLNMLLSEAIVFTRSVDFSNQSRRQLSESIRAVQEQMRQMARGISDFLSYFVARIPDMLHTVEPAAVGLVELAKYLSSTEFEPTDEGGADEEQTDDSQNNSSDASEGEETKQ